MEGMVRKNTRKVKLVEDKLDEMTQCNRCLERENSDLHEKLLDLEFRQRRNNLLFEGIEDEENETDLDAIAKLCSALSGIRGMDANFKIDRCHHIDDPFKLNANRRLICAFNWYFDV